MSHEQHSVMISAKHISQLILDGEVHKAILKSNHCLETLSSLQPSDIVYIEPRMRDETGHFYRLATAYENLLSTDHLSLAVLHRYGWFSNNGQGWSGVFPIPDHVPGHGKVSTQSQLAGFVRYFQYIFGKCLEQTQASLAIFPTIRFLTILAAIRAIEENPNSSGAILGVMETDFTPDCDDQSLIEGAFRSASELILSSKKAFLVFAESNSIRDYLLRAGFPANRVFVYPYPAAQRFGEIDSNTNPGLRKQFGCLGGTRSVHNPEVLASYLLKPSRHVLDWTVRLNLNLAAKNLNRDISDLRYSLQRANVRLLEHSLGDAEYDQVLQLLDVMLLPYGDRYQTIGSGIFFESICAGVIALVPANSTMYGLYLQLGGQAPAIDNPSVEGIGTAIDSCNMKFDELKGNAVQVRSAWLSHEQGPLNWSHHVIVFVQDLCFKQL